MLKCKAEYAIKSQTHTGPGYWHNLHLRETTLLRTTLATWQRSSFSEHSVDSDMKAIGFKLQCTTRLTASNMDDQCCPACLNDRVVGGLMLGEAVHHHIMECDNQVPLRRSPKVMRLLAHTLCEFCAKNDPGLIVKFLIYYKDRSVRMNSFSRASAGPSDKRYNRHRYLS